MEIWNTKISKDIHAQIQFNIINFDYAYSKTNIYIFIKVYKSVDEAKSNKAT